MSLDAETLRRRRAAARERRRRQVRRRRLTALGIAGVVVLLVVVVASSGGSSAPAHRAAAARAPERAVAPVGAQQGALRRFAALGKPIYCGARAKPLVALTFDDGPGPYTHLALR